MIGIYDYTVIATYVALMISIQGIFVSLSGSPAQGLICLILCGIIDTFDGKIARTKKDRTEDGKKFGIQIDSLNDLICFGVLPAAIGYSCGVDGLFGRISLALFALAALIRLAYFNVIEEKRQQETAADRTHYLGLPVTAVSVIMPLFYLLCVKLNLPTVPILDSMFVCLALAFIMPIQVKKLKLPGIIIGGILIATEAAMIVSTII